MTRLKKILSSKKMSQKSLADECGLGEFKISLLCTGKTTGVSLRTMHKICTVLECTLDEAFGDITPQD